MLSYFLFSMKALFKNMFFKNIHNILKPLSSHGHAAQLIPSPVITFIMFVIFCSADKTPTGFYTLPFVAFLHSQSELNVQMQLAIKRAAEITLGKCI